MKRLIILSIVVLALANEINAQRIGAGLAYAGELTTAGIVINGEFPLSSKMIAAPGLIFYFEDAWEINGNVNFNLSGNDAILPYVIAGINVISSNNNSEIGINAGIGANYDIGINPSLFTEAKYVLGNLDQLILAAGIKFPLNIN